MITVDLITGRVYRIKLAAFELVYKLYVMHDGRWVYLRDALPWEVQRVKLAYGWDETVVDDRRA